MSAGTVIRRHHRGATALAALALAVLVAAVAVVTGPTDGINATFELDLGGGT